MASIGNHRNAGLLVASFVAIATACSSGGVAGLEDSGEVLLVEVAPRGGQADVDPDDSIFLGFNHPMQAEMLTYVCLHEGDLNGAEVPGTWAWSDQHQRLHFTSHEPLHEQTRYTLHVGGGLVDQHGHHVNFEEHGLAMGGQWAHSSMMGQGQRHGQGPGWRHENGSYGMFFGFTTGG